MIQRCNLSDWKPYFGDRLISEHPAGFVVIVPVATPDVVPFECPVCKMMICSSDDAEYFKKKKCCSKCGMKWADSNLEKWMSGWRPSKEEIDSFVAERREAPVVLSL